MEAHTTDTIETNEPDDGTTTAPEQSDEEAVTAEEKVMNRENAE